MSRGTKDQAKSIFEGGGKSLSDKYSSKIESPSFPPRGDMSSVGAQEKAGI